MNSCCSASGCDNKHPRKHRCPVNSREYAEVSGRTIAHHIKESWGWVSTAERYYFCDDSECDVAYFGDDDSPQQIAGWLKHTYPCDENYHVSHETIYRSLFLQARGALKKELLQHLRRIRGMRRSRHHTQKTDTHGRITDTVSIKDTRLNMRLAGMVFGLEMIFNLGRSLCETDDEGRRSFLALPGLAIMTTGSLGWLAGRALKAAVSRQREFLADARAVQFTRSKEALGGVLRKVAGQQAAGGGTQRSLHPAVQHMLLVGASTEARWFASHPPLAERIRRIYADQ